MSEWTNEKRDQVIKTVYERSQSDVTFRRELVAHPHRAIQEATGEIVPDSFTLQFVDQDAARLTVVLPPLTKDENELSEQQLEAVAGGKGSMFTASPLWPFQGPGPVLTPGGFSTEPGLSPVHSPSSPVSAE